MVDRESWKIIEMIIRRYPAKKKEYEEYVSDIVGCNGTGEYMGCVISTTPQSITEVKALKLNSPYMDRIKREVYAVERVYNGLREEEQKIMRERFWTDRKRNIPYLQLKDICYSERQMKRIVYKIIFQIGKILGEVM